LIGCDVSTEMLKEGGVVTRIQDLDCYCYQQSVKFGLKLAVSADISADDRDLHEMTIQSSLRLLDIGPSAYLVQ
jgi:hypothetical protein